MSVSSDPLERQAARFIAAVCERLGPDRATLALSSPLAARSPDIDELWHRGLREAEPVRITRGLWRTLGREIIKGAARAIFEPRRYGCIVGGTPGDSLLVATAMCGSFDDAGGFTTPYVPTALDDAVFVFGTIDRFPQGTPPVKRLNPFEKYAIALSLAFAGIRGARAAGGDARDRRWLLLRWLSWSLGCVWLHELQLLRALRAHLGRQPASAVGCIHEMHAYSRTVWRVAREAGAECRTVQHAAVTTGKRWYFVEAEEIAAGLALPDVMHVFSPRVASMLAENWGSGRFPLGCSARYALWKGVEPAPLPESGPPRVVLFAGALVRFDNDALISAARALLADAYGLRVRFRLHPLADISPDDAVWLDAAVAAGSVERSTGVPLAEDLTAASVVVGMGTTVLEEALLLGRPVVRLADQRRVRYVDVDGIAGARTVDASEFSRSDVEAVSGSAVDSAAVRESLGIENPVVDYAQLFAG